MTDWIIERLDRRHDRKNFNCSKPTLDKWIAESARSNEEKNLSRTYVLVRPGEVLVRGYYSLSTCQVSTESIPLPHSKSLNLKLGIPAMRLGRLAVDVGFQKQGLGKYLLLQAMRRTLDASALCGCAVLTLDTRDEEAKSFYERMRFIPHEGQPDSLFFPVKWIEAMKLRPIVEAATGPMDGSDYCI